MLVVMVAIGTTDVLFALDSIPAIFGLTKEPYLVFAANAFALMGLMQLYFLLGGLLDRLVYLSIGLAVILGFIGVKLVLEALHTNTLPFINGGEPVEWAPEIPICVSLLRDRRRAGRDDRREPDHDPPGRRRVCAVRCQWRRRRRIGLSRSRTRWHGLVRDGECARRRGRQFAVASALRQRRTVESRVRDEREQRRAR